MRALYSNKQAAKAAPAKTSRPSRAAAAPVPPRVHVPTILVPQGNGEYLVKSGKPVVVAEEIKTAEFARLTGLSQRHILQLCDEGKLAFRRRTPRAKSQYLIPRAEVERFLKLEGEA